MYQKDTQIFPATLSTRPSEAKRRSSQRRVKPTIGDVIRVFWNIGFTSFGGTQAQLAQFYAILVEEQQWLTSEKFADYFGLTHAAPGAAAIQIVILTVAHATQSLMCGVVGFPAGGTMNSGFALHFAHHSGHEPYAIPGGRFNG